MAQQHAANSEPGSSSSHAGGTEARAEAEAGAGAKAKAEGGAEAGAEAEAEAEAGTEAEAEEAWLGRAREDYAWMADEFNRQYHNSHGKSHAEYQPHSADDELQLHFLNGRLW